MGAYDVIVQGCLTDYDRRQNTDLSEDEEPVAANFDNCVPHNLNVKQKPPMPKVINISAGDLESPGIQSLSRSEKFRKSFGKQMSLFVNNNMHATPPVIGEENRIQSFLNQTQPNFGGNGSKHTSPASPGLRLNGQKRVLRHAMSAAPDDE